MIFSSIDELLITPLEWRSQAFESWYFEKQTDRWTEYSYNQARNFYTEISVDLDSDGFLVVVLENFDDKSAVKLTEGICHFGKNLSYIGESYAKGYWVKNGKLTINN